MSRKAEPYSVIAADEALGNSVGFTSDEVAVTRDHRGVRPILSAEFAAKRLRMELHRGFMKIVVAGDLLIGLAPADAPQYVQLAIRQKVGTIIDSLSL